MKSCLKLLLSLPDSAQEAFARRVERGLSLGASQEEAKREASRMLMDDLKAEAEMVEKALREQHPEVFSAGVRDAVETQADRERSLDEKRVSPRLPTAVKAVEDSLGAYRLQPDLKTAKRDPAAFAHNIDLMSQYPNFQGLQGSAEDRAESIVQQAVGNLLWLHDHWNPAQRGRSKMWYVGGNRISHRWAARFGVTPEQVAAVIAATSPQKDWFQNVSLAERILEAVVNNSSAPWDSSMSGLVREREWGRKVAPDPSVYVGKTLRDLYGAGTPGALMDMAIWIRAWDEAKNPQMARVITPEGRFADFDKGKTGKPVALRWQSFPAITKALQNMLANTPADISAVIGSNHKVRSFYNNIIAPYASEDVTIDTHAVAAALLRPLGSSSTEVLHNFGSGVKGSAGPSNSAITGLYGTYAIYAEAYRRAANQRGLLPREMQSITWEAVRGLFRPEQKNDKIRLEADMVWRNAAAGETSVQEARRKIERLVGGIQDPAWIGSAAGVDEGRGDSSYAREVPRAGGSEGAAGGRGGAGAASGDQQGRAAEVAGIAGDIGVGAKFSRDEGQFELPEFGPGSRAQLALQDRYNRWKQAVQAVREQGGNVNEYNDFYLAEERYWGRVGAQNEAFGKEVEDFVEAVKKDGLTLQDVAEYVYAKHAAERNAYVAKMRDDMEGTGSGMTDEEADSILIAAEQSGLEPLLMKHAEKLYEWIDGTRQVMLENGLISEAEANSWEGMFTHYVPLRGLEGKEPQGKGTGSGFNIKGRESKQITGRRSKAKQIIEQIIQDRTKAYIRAGKNEVLRTFLNFALENPSPNLWKVSAVETKPTVVVDEFGNRTVEQREMLVTDPRRVVSLKDGGQTIHIEVKDQELLKQLQNGYATTPIAPVAAMLWANRTVGAMLTAFSPVFVAMNAVRDAQTAFFGMIGVKGYKGAGNLALQYPAALREAFKAHFGEPSAEYREYLLAGGTTGYFGLKELDETGEELAALVRRLGPLEFDPKKPLQFAGDAAYKLAGPIAKFVENVNGVVEQTTRFAAYRAAKRSGSTVAESASISKNLTVNFNRKGSLANFTGAAVLFFNPAVQGTARLAQAMKSPKVWGALGGAAAGVFFLALANADLGGEDDDGVSFWDKVPREVKERNLVIMRPPVRKEDGTLESRYIKIPVAYGYNVFLVAAYEMADALRHRDDKTKGREPMESASRVATAFLGATLPVQALGQSLEDSASLTMAPYSNALGPVAQALANKSGFGRPLYPETQNTKYLPDSQKFSVGQAGTIFQKAAEKLNEAAGGDKFTSSGWLTDIAPGSLENAARFYGGGLTSMTLDIMNAFYVRQHIERPEPDLKRLPFVKQFYGSINDETDRWFAYERMNKAERATQPLEAAIRAGDAQAVETILKREPLAVAGKALDQIRQSLSDIRKAELAIIQDPDLRDGERYIRLMEQSKNAREVLRQWNTVYDDLNKRQEPAR